MKTNSEHAVSGLRLILAATLIMCVQGCANTRSSGNIPRGGKAEVSSDSAAAVAEANTKSPERGARSSRGSEAQISEADAKLDIWGAAAQGKTAVVKRLIESGCDLNEKSFGEMPLHYAANNGHTDIVELLLKAGANPNGKDDAGETPLHSAVMEGKQDVAARLLDKGADVNAQDDQGATALHVAAMKGRPELVDLLLAKGADPLTADKQGRTPMFYSKITGGKCSEILKSKGASDVSIPPSRSGSHWQEVLFLNEGGDKGGINYVAGNRIKLTPAKDEVAVSSGSDPAQAGTFAFNASLEGSEGPVSFTKVAMFAQGNPTNTFSAERVATPEPTFVLHGVTHTYKFETIETFTVEQKKRELVFHCPWGSVKTGMYQTSVSLSGNGPVYFFLVDNTCKNTGRPPIVSNIVRVDLTFK
jgi:hypothetical protein